MGYTLTTKSQVTIPKAIRDELGVGPGKEVDFKILKKGEVRIFSVKKKQSRANPFTQFIGKGIAGKSTEQLLDESRGKGWNK